MITYIIELFSTHEIILGGISILILLFIVFYLLIKTNNDKKGHRYRKIPKCNADSEFIAHECVKYRYCGDCPKYK